MKTLDDCFRKGLRKVRSDPGSAGKCLVTAASHLDDAEASFEIRRYRLTLTSSYEAMFHAAKALLFMDGNRLNIKTLFYNNHVDYLNIFTVTWHFCQSYIKIITI